MCSVASSSSVHSRSFDAVVDRQRAPQMAVRKDRHRQERLDVLLFEVGSQKAFEVARVSREDLALPLVLRQPFQQWVRIDDRLHDHRRRCQFATISGVDPVGRHRLGKALAGQLAQPKQDAALAIHGRAQRFKDAAHLALPVASFVKPANDVNSGHRRALPDAVPIAACFSRHGQPSFHSRATESGYQWSRRSVAFAGRQREDIAFAADCAQEFRIGRVRLDLLPQPHDADIDRA